MPPARFRTTVRTQNGLTHVVKPNDLDDFTALLDSLVQRGFWGSLRVQLQAMVTGIGGRFF